MYKKILVPLDGSELAEKALPHAVAVAKGSGAEVTLLTVVQQTLEFTSAKLEAIPEALAERRAALRAEARMYLDKIQRDLQSQAVAARTVALDGDVAAEIIAYAEREGFDLVTMATHGRSGISRFIMGSIAEKVVRGTVKPVLLIRVAPVPPRPVDWRDVMLPPAP